MCLQLALGGADGRAVVVRKYVLSLIDADWQELAMPAGANLLHVDEQAGKICLWALIDPDGEPEARTFTIAGTGHRVPETAIYVGTVQVEKYVWHVFEDAHWPGEPERDALIRSIAGTNRSASPPD